MKAVLIAVAVLVLLAFGYGLQDRTPDPFRPGRMQNEQRNMVTWAVIGLLLIGLVFAVSR